VAANVDLRQAVIIGTVDDVERFIRLLRGDGAANVDARNLRVTFTANRLTTDELAAMLGRSRVKVISAASEGGP